MLVFYASRDDPARCFGDFRSAAELAEVIRHTTQVRRVCVDCWREAQTDPDYRERLVKCKEFIPFELGTDSEHLAIDIKTHRLMRMINEPEFVRLLHMVHTVNVWKPDSHGVCEASLKKQGFEVKFRGEWTMFVPRKQTRQALELARVLMPRPDRPGQKRKRETPALGRDEARLVIEMLTGV